MNDVIRFPALLATQPIGSFYIGVIDSDDLIAISYADVRRPEGRDLERYIGTQRNLSEGRVAELKRYVTTMDACFPTGIILAISSENASFDEKRGQLVIKKDEEAAKIIDGQHRIEGLKGYKGDPFQLNVTIFVDMELEDQAMVFATINLKQTKVSKSLAYDLYEYAESRSPQKTSHNVAKLMNFKVGSPFRGRIKILGKATGAGMETLTQATFVDRLLKMITTDPMKDRDLIKRGKPLVPATERESVRLIFRNRFIVGKDAEIAKMLWNYFEAVSEVWPEAWNNFDQGHILSRTTGFAALMRFLPDINAALGSTTGIPAVSDFRKPLRKVKLRDADFNSDRFKPGSSGEGDLYEALKGGL
ncbi:MAG: DGQHR domain-containing protein [Betaproteobacteria bacterium]|nr:DGQHR domain-containing protein [Betaproteobacteria bacterium]